MTVNYGLIEPKSNIFTLICIGNPDLSFACHFRPELKLISKIDSSTRTHSSATSFLPCRSRTTGKGPSTICDRCYDFLNIFAEKFSKKLTFLTQIKAKLCKNCKNCYHNIDPLALPKNTAVYYW
jgi:hypothetical protein